MLQTDFHYRGNDEDTSSDIRGNIEKQVPHPASVAGAEFSTLFIVLIRADTKLWIR